MFSIKIFKKHCSREWLPVFELNNQVFEVKAKQRIFSEGEPVKGIYFIEKGKAKVLSKFNDKEEKIIRIASDGAILGHRGINVKKYPISAEALTDSTITFVPIQVFMNILETNSGMAIYLINFMSDELRDSEERMKSLLILDPKIRVAIILVKLIDSFGYDPISKNKLTFTLSRADIANMAGTSYETVIRTLALLKDSELISLENKEIVVLNEKKLRILASEVVSVKQPGKKPQE